MGLNTPRRRRIEDAVNGSSKISAFQTLTQPFRIVLHLMPFVLLA